MENNDCIRIVFMKFCILNVLKIKVSGFLKNIYRVSQDT